MDYKRGMILYTNVGYSITLYRFFVVEKVTDKCIVLCEVGKRRITNSYTPVVIPVLNDINRDVKIRVFKEKADIVYHVYDAKEKLEEQLLD